LSWPVPQPGLVIWYSYLWEKEARKGREEGTKDRPCAIVLAMLRQGKHPIVRVLPITHTPPADENEAIEIPTPTKKRLGLDTERSWVVLAEANDFIWPGPDLRPPISGDPASVAIGFLPPKFMRVLQTRLADLYRQKKAKTTRRTEGYQSSRWGDDEAPAGAWLPSLSPAGTSAAAIASST
jgi:hypothetical protein